VKCFSLMLALGSTRSQIARLMRSLDGITSEIAGGRRNASAHEAKIRRWYKEFRVRLNGSFGMTGSIAVIYGTAAAGDIFLPFIVQDYKLAFHKLLTVLQSNPRFRGLAQKLTNEGAGLEGMDLKGIRDRVRRQLTNYGVSR
jgi:hypothetical protein